MEHADQPSRADSWQLRHEKLRLGRRPLLMGILNVTPDSFSDGGKFFDPAVAVEQGLRLVAEGADLLDIGGESTRPYAVPVDEAEELRRVVPVLGALCRQIPVPVSIDTTKAAVAREALAAGAQIINDVTALAGDPQMVQVAVDSGAGLCAMHLPGTPQTMQDKPSYRDVVDEVYEYLRQRRDALAAAGIARQRIALDPGIGFGKNLAHNLALLSHIDQLHDLGCPVLVGPSRKAFIGRILGDERANRTAGTIGVALSLAVKGVQILRVHDVAAVRAALILFEATGGLDS